MADLFSREAEDMNAAAGATPTPQLDPGFGATFAASWEASQRHTGALFGVATQSRNEGDFLQQRLDNFQTDHAEKIPNPYASIGAARVPAMEYARKRFAEKGEMFPDDNDIMKGGLRLAKNAVERDKMLSGGPQGFSAWSASGLAGLAEGVADPANLIAILAAPEGGALLMAALRVGGAMAGQQVITEAITYGHQKRIDPEHSIGDAAASVIEAGLGGAIMEGGVRGIGAAWRKLRGKSVEQAGSLPLEVRDAGIVAERSADLEANNPFRGTEGAVAHNDAIISMERDFLDGKAPSLPAGADTELKARHGQVFAAREPSAMDYVESHAIRANPDLFDKVSRIENGIHQARVALQEHLTPKAQDATFGQLSVRIQDLEQQLSEITGKRRSSPRAIALRDEIEALKASDASLSEQAISKDPAAEQALRLRLNELVMERAELGPQVRAAREEAARAQGIRIDHAKNLDSAPTHSGAEWVPPAVKEKAAPPPQVGKSAKAKDGPKAEKPKAPKRQRLIDLLPPEPAPEELDAVRLTSRLDAGAGVAPRRTFFGNRGVDVKYELVEARDLVTSHDHNFNINPAYPEELQPRNRAGRPAQEQVYSIAQNLQPERMGPNVEANSGAPIVGPNGIVESGNGRTMAVRMAYGMGDERAGAYRAFLERSGYDTSNFKEPILVGRRLSKMTDEERASFAHAANGSSSLRMSATEMALSDARHLSSDITHLIRGSDINSIENRDFVRAFISRLPAGERGSIMTASGDLSAAGVNRVNAALVARAYGDPSVVARAFDHADSNIKTIASAMVESSGDWIKMRDAVARGEIPASHDITDHFMQAVQAVMKARDARVPVSEIMNQGDMFLSDTSQLAARLMFKDGGMQRFLSKGAISENLSTFAREIEAGAGKGVDMFGQAPPNAKEVMTGVVRKSDAHEAAAIAAARDPKALELAFDDPKVHEAAQAQLQRNIEQGRNRVPVSDADGNTTLGFADAELHKADSRLLMAEEIKSCTTIPKGDA